MEHHPYLSFDDGLEITYSDLKKRKSGSEYLTIYFEQPNEDGTDFKSARCDFPGGGFSHVVGYSQDELDKLWQHVARAGGLAIELQKDPLYA